jgi:hypothetical protein
MIVLHKTIKIHSGNQLIKTTDIILNKIWRVASISIYLLDVISVIKNIMHGLQNK